MRPGFEKPVYSGCKERIQPGRNLLPLKKTKANPLDRLQACFSRQPIDFWVDKHHEELVETLSKEQRTELIGLVNKVVLFQDKKRGA